MRDQIETREISDADLDAVAGGTNTATVNLPGLNVRVGSLNEVESAGFAQLQQGLGTAVANVSQAVPAGALQGLV